MFTMAVGQSDDIDPADAIAAAIEQCRASLNGLTPQAGILFASFDSFDPTIVEAVLDAFPGISVMGSTSAAEISSDGYLEDSLSLAVFASDEVDITVGVGTGLPADPERACRTAVAQALAATRLEPKVCIVLAEVFGADPGRTLTALGDALPAGVVIVGGASAGQSFAAARPSYQFGNGEVADDGVSVMLFSGRLAYATGVGSGWRMIGTSGIVTGSSNGLVEEIDGRPAIEFLAPYLEVTGFASYGNPLAITESPGDDSYLRVMLGSVPETGAVIVMGLVPVGASVQLTIADTEDILGGTRGALAEATADFPTGSTPAAALIFSCAVRKFLLGSKTQVEAELARAEYGTTLPIAGMYCFGEMGPIGGAGGTTTSRFFNETFVTLLLGT